MLWRRCFLEGTSRLTVIWLAALERRSLRITTALNCLRRLRSATTALPGNLRSRSRRHKVIALLCQVSPSTCWFFVCSETVHLSRSTPGPVGWLGQWWATSQNPRTASTKSLCRRSGEQWLTLMCTIESACHLKPCNMFSCTWVPWSQIATMPGFDKLSPNGGGAHPRNVRLNNATVLPQACAADFSSYLGVVSLLNPCCVPA